MPRGRPKGAKDLKPRKRRGAPSPVAAGEQTAASRGEVAALVALGHDAATIARTVGMTVEEVRARFAAELADAEGLVARAENDSRLLKAAEAGNVAAIKALGEKLQIADADRRARGDAEQGELPMAPPPALGKKEQRAAAAAVAGKGTDWEDLLGDAPTAQ